MLRCWSVEGRSSSVVKVCISGLRRIAVSRAIIPPTSPPHGTTAPSGAGPPHYRGFTIILKTHHTRLDSSGRVISPTQRPIPDKTQHSQEPDTSMPTAGFEPAIPGSERPQTHNLDSAATGIGMSDIYLYAYRIL